MWAYAFTCVTVWLLLSRSAWFRDRAGAAGFFAVEGGGILWQPQGTGLVLGRVGSRLARPLEWWFRVGCWVCCVVAVVCAAATGWGAAQGTAQLLHRFGLAPGGVAAAAATPAGGEVSTPVLQPLLPGVTVPGSEVPYLVVSVLLCLVWHELGHGLCAVSLKLHVQSGGVALAWFVVPTAFVTIEDHLRRIAPVKQLRIYTAGAWHNLTHGLLCACLVLFLPQLLTPLYSTCSDDASCLWIAEDRAKLFGATLCEDGGGGGGGVGSRLPSTPAPVALLTLNGRTKDGWEEVLREADSGRQRLSLSRHDYETLRSEVVNGGSSSNGGDDGSSGGGGLLQFEVETLANVSAAAALPGTTATATATPSTSSSPSPSSTPLSARPRTRMIISLSGRRVIEKAASFNVSSSSGSSSGSVVLRFVPPASGEGLFAFELMRGMPGGGDGGGGVRVKAGVLASSAAVRGLALRRFAPRYSVGGAVGAAALPVFPTLLEACGVTEEEEDGDGVRPPWWRIAVQAAYANAPLHIGALLMYTQMISFGLVLVNLLPCTTLDGDHALLCLLRMAHSRGWVGRGFDDDACDAEAGVCSGERSADVAIDIPSSPVIELYEGGDHNPTESLLRLHSRIVAACTALLAYTVLVSVVLVVGR